MPIEITLKIETLPGGGQKISCDRGGTGNELAEMVADYLLKVIDRATEEMTMGAGGVHVSRIPPEGPEDQ